MRRYFLLALCCLCLVGTAKMQAQGLRNRPLSVSLFNEGTAIPFATFITTPIHPGLQLGTDFDYGSKERKHGRFFQSVNLGYYFHNYFAQGLYLNTEAGYEYRSSFGLSGAARLGVGCLHTWATQQEYTLVNGEYVAKPDKGNARVMPSIALELGWYLKKSEPHSPKLFLMYQGWVEYPFSPGFIPLMSHVSLHAGLRFYPFAHKNEEAQL